MLFWRVFIGGLSHVIPLFFSTPLFLACIASEILCVSCHVSPKFHEFCQVRRSSAPHPRVRRTYPVNKHGHLPVAESAFRSSLVSGHSNPEKIPFRSKCLERSMISIYISDVFFFPMSPLMGCLAMSCCPVLPSRTVRARFASVPVPRVQNFHA